MQIKANNKPWSKHCCMRRKGSRLCSLYLPAPLQCAAIRTKRAHAAHFMLGDVCSARSFLAELWRGEASTVLSLDEVLCFIISSYQYSEEDLSTVISDETANMFKNYLFSLLLNKLYNILIQLKYRSLEICPLIYTFEIIFHSYFLNQILFLSDVFPAFRMHYILLELHPQALGGLEGF